MRKKIVIVGLGLIGGSIAKALKMNTEHEIYGIDTNDENLLDACSCGAIDGKAARTHISEADMVYLCIYPDAAIEFIKGNASFFKKDCIVTDTCGVKGKFCAAVKELSHNRDFVFVAGHPMAGKERSGFAASDPSIFVGASYLIAPCGAPEWAVECVSELAVSMGFGNVVMTTPEEHDRMIAFTSQLPHVLACAYVLSPQCGHHRGFSAGSYRDVSRVALINDELWTDLFLHNSEALVKELDILENNISYIKSTIAEGKRDDLKAVLKKAADIKRKEG